ncbi:hypothetical protein HY479_03300 [Candidatus Uhrbacteria bacterium]|nr:hypothetical protein [Candidatus Uhrbacteria bacterium]
MEYEATSSAWSALTVLTVIGGLAVAVFLVWLVRKVSGVIARPEMYGISRQEVKSRWENIRNTSRQGTMGAKLAILEADALLDAALKSMTMPGESLAERLRVARYKYPKLNKVWWAHKLRNQLVHESSFQVGSRQAKQALDEFERALKTLNLL